MPAFSATAPALLYLLHPCRQPVGEGVVSELIGMGITQTTRPYNYLITRDYYETYLDNRCR